MADPLVFDTTRPMAGVPQRVADRVIRLVAANPGPFTQSGTCSYVLEGKALTVIDPGPADDMHLAGLLAVIDDRPVEAILLTHTHKDHSPLAAAVKNRTGAPVFSAGPHRLARPALPGETMLLDASIDADHLPDAILNDGQILAFAAGTIRVIATPGHTMNHLCFALDDDQLLLSGDHVMAWSTSIIAPPDGAMRPYLASLRALILEADRYTSFLPGHGNPVQRPAAFCSALLEHRLQREAAVLSRLAAGDGTPAEIVRASYHGLAEALFVPAQLSVLAQLEALVEDGRAIADMPGLLGRFRLP